MCADITIAIACRGLLDSGSSIADGGREFHGREQREFPRKGKKKIAPGSLYLIPIIGYFRLARMLQSATLFISIRIRYEQRR